ncbi:MAG: hypothetical protein RBU37_28185 [Myxococcota bacterium]|nr:hypothetical protein [Myxococcota bacterium]
MPQERHREAWAIEKRSPSREEVEQTSVKQASAAQAEASALASAADAPKEILVVASRYQGYLGERLGAECRVERSLLHRLSEALRELCDDGIVKARADGRKTLMARDLPKPAPAPASEMLIVVTKVKEYVRSAAGMNTSGDVAELLSAHLRSWTHEAARRALREEREQVQVSDFL